MISLVHNDSLNKKEFEKRFYKNYFAITRSLRAGKYELFASYLNKSEKVVIKMTPPFTRNSDIAEITHEPEYVSNYKALKDE